MGNTTSYTIPQTLIRDIEKNDTKQYLFKAIMKSRIPFNINMNKHNQHNQHNHHNQHNQHN